MDVPDLSSLEQTTTPISGNLQRPSPHPDSGLRPNDWITDVRRREARVVGTRGSIEMLSRVASERMIGGIEDVERGWELKDRLRVRRKNWQERGKG